MSIRWRAPAAAVLFALGSVGFAHAGPDVPGGYTKVAAENMVATDRGPISGTVEGGRASVGVPAGALPYGLDVQITTADRAEVEAGLASLGYSGHHAIATVGVHVRNPDGSKYLESSGKPIAVTVTGPDVRPGQFVLRLNSANSADRIAAVISDGAAEINITEDADLVVLASSQGAPPAVTAGASDPPQSQERWTAAGIALLISTVCTVTTGVMLRRAANPARVGDA